MKIFKTKAWFVASIIKLWVVLFSDSTTYPSSLVLTLWHHGRGDSGDMLNNS